MPTGNSSAAAAAQGGPSFGEVALGLGVLGAQQAWEHRDLIGNALVRASGGISADLASSHLSHMDWVATGTLQVTFRNGDSYIYNNVDRETAEALRDAPSPGSFLWQNLRGREASHHSKKS
jgi:hypothetical protein